MNELKRFACCYPHGPSTGPGEKRRAEPVYVPWMGEPVNDRQREMFVRVVDAGSFSKAAEAEFVTPQSVSQQIRRLEEELGVTLLERSARGVVTTEAGQAFYEGCQEVDRALAEVVGRCRVIEQRRLPTATLRVALGNHYSLGLISKIMPRYLQEYPHVTIRYVDPGHTSDVACLLNDDCDLIETVRPCVASVGFLPLYRSRRCCMVAPSNPLATRSRVYPEDLRNQTAYVFSLAWAADLQAYIQRFVPGYELHEMSGSFESTVAQGPEGACSVYLLPEHLKDRFGMLIPVPFDADVLTEYGVAYREDAGEATRGFLALAQEEYGCMGKAEKGLSAETRL